MKLHAVLVVLFGAFLVLPSNGGEGQSDEKKLEGTWKLVSGEKDGKPLPEEILKTAKLVIKGDKHTVTIGDEKFVGTHKLDPTTKPKSIDATDTAGTDKGKAMRGIYAIKGDEFKVAFGEPDGPRPKNFSGKHGFSHVWKRVKK